MAVVMDVVDGAIPCAIFYAVLSVCVMTDIKSFVIVATTVVAGPTVTAVAVIAVRGTTAIHFFLQFNIQFVTPTRAIVRIAAVVMNVSLLPTLITVLVGTLSVMFFSSRTR